MKNEEQTIAKNLELFNTYLNENEAKFSAKLIRNEILESLNFQRQNLRHFLKIGRLVSIGINEFNSAEAKQARKNLGLKISVEYFILNAYGYSKKQAYNLKNCYELSDEIKEAYLNSGILESELSMRGLLNFANPKETSEEATEETSEEATEETSEEATEETVEKFGGIELHLKKASKKDIEQAIAYLTTKLA